MPPSFIAGLLYRNRTFLLLAFSASFAIAPLHAAPKSRRTQPVASSEVSAPAPSPVIEFYGDDVSAALRSLARTAKLNMVVSDAVTGTVSLRVEDKTPREAIEIIAASKDLIIHQSQGIFYVRPRNPPPPPIPKAPEPKKSLEEEITAVFGPAIIKFYDEILDYEARPETAQKIARTKKVLYDAFIAEGFTKEEAFRLILSPQGNSLPNLQK